MNGSDIEAAKIGVRLGTGSPDFTQHAVIQLKKYPGGFAGGVVGSGVDASLYYPGPMSGRGRAETTRRPKTKEVKINNKILAVAQYDSFPTIE